MDIFFRKNRKKLIPCICAFAGCLLMIANPAIVLESSKKAIGLWASDIVPAMLPFFICVNYLSVSGIIMYLPQNIFPFVMSVLSGYPMGAKIVGDMCRSGSVNTAEAKRLVSFCSTSGPAFITGAVGTGMLGFPEAGLIVAFAHYAGAVCNGIVYTAIFRREKDRQPRDKGTLYIEGQGQFAEAAVSSFKSLGIILVYIIIFMLVSDYMDCAGLFDRFHSPEASCVARGILEMTVGCSYIAASGIGSIQACVVAAVIISWGGLSVIGQSASMLAGTGVKAGYIAVTKVTHSFFAGIIALFIARLML